jgi:hypothetical protein
MIKMISMIMMIAMVMMMITMDVIRSAGKGGSLSPKRTLGGTSSSFAVSKCRNSRAALSCDKRND